MNFVQAASIRKVSNTKRVHGVRSNLIPKWSIYITKKVRAKRVRSDTKRVRVSHLDDSNEEEAVTFFFFITLKPRVE